MVLSSSISSISSLQTSSADSWLQSLTSSQPQISGHAASGAIFTSLASVSSKLSVDVPSEVEISSKSNGTSSGYNSPSSTNSTHSASWQQDVSKSILEDPFDAEWAAIATRNTEVTQPTQQSSTNPFLAAADQSQTKAFELQL